MNIYFLNGSRQNEVFELNPQGTKIGRETDNDISILEAGLSRYHAIISQQDDRWAIEDLNSTNGVKINGERITGKKPLTVGDELQLGNQKFYFGPSAPAAAAETAGGDEKKDRKADADTLQKENDAFSFDLNIKQPEPLADKKEDQGTASPAGGDGNNQKKGEDGVKIGAPEPLGGGTKEEPAKVHESLDEKVSEERKEEIKSFFDSLGNNEKVERQESDGDAFEKQNWFGGDKEKKSDSGASKERSGSNRRMTNLMFYVIVISVAVIFVSAYIKFFESDGRSRVKESIKTARSAEERKQNSLKKFLLVYKKEIFSNDNVFRYYLKIENGKALVELDDLKHKRRFTEPIKELKLTDLDVLMSAIKDTGFMALKQTADGLATGDKDVSRSLTISYSNDVNTISVKNKFAPSSFEKVEAIVEEFSSDYLGAPLVLTVEEMKAYAEAAFRKAEQLFANRNARPENLNEAIKRYKIVLEQLDTFSPKPQIWDVARKRVAEAKEMLQNEIKAHMFNAFHAYKMKNYQKARDEYAIVVQMLDPGDKRYEKARRHVNDLELHLQRSSKKKRK